jgi:hypothetical protein
VEPQDHVELVVAGNAQVGMVEPEQLRNLDQEPDTRGVDQHAAEVDDDGSRAMLELLEEKLPRLGRAVVVERPVHADEKRSVVEPAGDLGEVAAPRPRVECALHAHVLTFVQIPYPVLTHLNRPGRQPAHARTDRLLPANGGCFAVQLAYLAAARSNEQAHYAALAKVLGSAAPKGLRFRYPAGAFHSMRAAAVVGSALETAFVGAYLGAVKALRDDGLKAVAAQIGANEAQHLTIFNFIGAGTLVQNPAFPKVFTAAQATKAVGPFLG